MATIMKASAFVKKLEDIANNYKTLYVMGCFGAPMNAKNKQRYAARPDNAKRVANINAATSDTFGFDCVNLIKGVLWGWTGDPEKTYGGAKYKANGVPDTNANGMIKLCTGVTTDFSKIEVGEAVWCEGHIGVYIGNGLAIESTPAWKNKVQITAVSNIGKKSGYNSRKWTKHGKLPFIEYDVTDKPKEEKPATKPATSAVKVDAALHKDSSLAGTYKVTALIAMHIRAGAGTSKKSLGTLKRGAIVRNYGYYNVSGSRKWLYVATEDGKLGYCSALYLKKC